MAQTYKKVLILLLVLCLAGLNTNCQKKGCPTNYPYKPGLFPITIPFKEYRLKRGPFDKQKKLNRAEKRIKRKAIKNKHDELNSQKIARKKHISQQTPKVQERMKKSFIESERTRKRKTLWERILFWKKLKGKEKRIK